MHLSLEKKEITHHFLSFLKNQATEADAIYILGDLFDSWVGDDNNMPPNKKIKAHFKQLTDSGTQVFLQQGNRDFLLGQVFCDETGIVLLGEYAVIDLFGVKTLLMHGDLLCSDDLDYQAFREKSHTKEWQDNVLSKPLILRLLVVRWYRFRSFFHKRKKTQEIMDVNQQTVVKQMSLHHCLRLIHGHTHRPALHSLIVDGSEAQRFVLAEWKKDAVEILQWQPSGYRVNKII